ncbi:MAG TPA: cytochrome P450 [Propionibacteriaceae bacterium]|nr:cytochrome P450 [Propionibacteriaceae bacterium]
MTALQSEVVSPATQVPMQRSRRLTSVGLDNTASAEKKVRTCPTPGPRGILSVPGSLRGFQRDAPQLFLDLRRTYGDMVRLPLGFFTVHLPFHPDAIRYVLQDNNANYVRGKGYDAFKTFMGTGLLTTDGAAWRSRRRIVNPLFHKGALATMEDAMTGSTARVLDRWERSSVSGQPLDVVPEMMDLTLGALGEVMFDTDLEPDQPRIGPAMVTAIEAMVFRGTLPQLLREPIPTTYNKNIRDAREVMYGIVQRIVDAHRNGSHTDRVDLVRLLLETTDAETGEGLPADQIRDEIMTIFMAGHETTGTGVSWALWELARNLDVQERVHDEVETVLGGRAPRLVDLPNLPVTRMVIDETLRLHPPIWVYPRDAVEEDVIDGWRIPAGGSVFLCPYVTHRHPDFWVAPNRFDPDRFAENAPARPRYAYFPFGGGQRKCIGNQMALQQTHLSLAMIIQRFRLGVPESARLEQGTLVSLRPTSGIRLTLERRKR